MLGDKVRCRDCATKSESSVIFFLCNNYTEYNLAVAMQEPREIDNVVTSMVSSAIDRNQDATTKHETKEKTTTLKTWIKLRTVTRIARLYNCNEDEARDIYRQSYHDIIVAYKHGGHKVVWSDLDIECFCIILKLDHLNQQQEESAQCDLEVYAKWEKAFFAGQVVCREVFLSFAALVYHINKRVLSLRAFQLFLSGFVSQYNKQQRALLHKCLEAALACLRDETTQQAGDDGYFSRCICAMVVHCDPNNKDKITRRLSYLQKHLNEL